MTDRQFHKGDVIFRQGDLGTSFFRILDGSVGIFLNYEETDERKLTELAKDQYFGEMAILESYPRSATAVSLSDETKVSEITSEEVNDYLGDHPDHILSLMEHLGNRLRDLTKDYNEASALLVELKGGKTEKNEGFFQKLKKFTGFRRSADVTSVETARAQEEKKLEGFSKKVDNYPAGTVICKEGETGDCMYAIHWGRVGIYTGYGTDNEKKLTELYPNKFFGELGMICKEPRSATAVTLDNDTAIETIYPDDLTELFEKNPLKVNMILSNLSFRLRRLTDDYTAVCTQICEATEKLS